MSSLIPLFLRFELHRIFLNFILPVDYQCGIICIISIQCVNYEQRYKLVTFYRVRCVGSRSRVSLIKNGTGDPGPVFTL